MPQIDVFDQRHPLVWFLDLNRVLGLLPVRSEPLNLANLQSPNKRKHFFSSRRYSQRLTLEYGEWRVRQALSEEHQALRGVIPPRAVGNSLGAGALSAGRLCPRPCFLVASRKAGDQLARVRSSAGRYGV